MSTVPRPVIIAGAVGSPYTRKMRALLRYRRIPYQYTDWGSPALEELPPRPRPLMPCIWLPEGESGWQALSDSTFQIRSLEERYPGRSVIPNDAGLAFLSSLLEDYADEWVTKPMFFYRWAIEENVDHACNVLPLWSLAPDEMVARFRPTFGQRQIDRLSGVVTGDLEVCGPIIEASYRRLLALLREHLRTSRFVLGDRPSAGDFGLYGQLTQLVGVEPTSMALARSEAPRVMAWVDVVEDLSGWSAEGDSGWTPREALGDTFRELLVEVGRTYAPFMLANAQAVDAGDDETHCTIDGQRYWQKAFGYQRKCLGWLQDEYRGLSPDDRSFVDKTLAGTGCEALLV